MHFATHIVTHTRTFGVARAAWVGTLTRVGAHIALDTHMYKHSASFMRRWAD